MGGGVAAWFSGPGKLVAGCVQPAGSSEHPFHSNALHQQRSTARGLFLAARAELDGVSQRSEDCRWAQFDHCCSVLADKHKLERFLRPDAALVVTVYAPITFPPASVLLFKQRSNGELDANVSRLCVPYF